MNLISIFRIFKVTVKNWNLPNQNKMCLIESTENTDNWSHLIGYELKGARFFYVMSKTSPTRKLILIGWFEPYPNIICCESRKSKIRVRKSKSEIEDFLWKSGSSDKDTDEELLDFHKVNCLFISSLKKIIDFPGNQNDIYNKVNPQSISRFFCLKLSKPKNVKLTILMKSLKLFGKKLYFIFLEHVLQQRHVFARVA